MIDAEMLDLRDTLNAARKRFRGIFSEIYATQLLGEISEGLCPEATQRERHPGALLDDWPLCRLPLGHEGRHKNRGSEWVTGY